MDTTRRSCLQLNMQYYARIESEGEFRGRRVLKFHPQLEPGQTDEFAIDVSGHTREGQLLLKDLIGMELVVGDGPDNQTWLPEDLSVGINGVQVLTRTCGAPSSARAAASTSSTPIPRPRWTRPCWPRRRSKSGASHNEQRI